MLIKKPYLLIFWFLPIFNTMYSVKFAEIGIIDYVRYLQLGLVLLGLFYLLIKSTTAPLSFGVLIILLLLAFNILYSDIREYQFVAFLLGYAWMVHMMAKKYPYEIWSQYYFICLVIAWFSIIDLFSYFILGDFIISYRTPVPMGNGLARINTIFDEMSHQAFFLMPAVIFSLVNNSKMRYLLLISLLSTMSVAALLLFSAALLVYMRKKILHNLRSISPVIIIVVLALFLGSEYIISKMSGIFINDALITGESTKEISAGNILLGIEMLKAISLNDLFFGYGYFGLAENVPQLIFNSEFYSYFETLGYIDEPRSVGILNLVFYFGLFQCCLMALALFKIKKYANDVWLYKLAIFVVFLSLIKNSHTIDYLIHLFFVFSLSWASTRPISEELFVRHSDKILNR
tara:strand:- start:813 stop:2021 length:1209 start_codon:yes stop_codon:yes gene_type:complete